MTDLNTENGDAVTVADNALTFMAERLRFDLDERSVGEQTRNLATSVLIVAARGSDGEPTSGKGHDS